MIGEEVGWTVDDEVNDGAFKGTPGLHDDLEQEVEASQAMLTLLGSTKYISSANCLREVAAASPPLPPPRARVSSSPQATPLAPSRR